MGSLVYVQEKKYAQSAGFEPARAEPNGFLVHRLNHSATTAMKKGWLKCAVNIALSAFLTCISAFLMCISLETPYAVQESCQRPVYDSLTRAGWNLGVYKPGLQVV